MRLLFYLGFLFSLSCIFLVACQPTPPEPTPKALEEPAVVPSLKRRFFRTQTPRLRVRQTPDLEGAVLQILPEGSIVEYLYDSTTFTTPITYNQKEYDTHWYRIQTEEQNKGWVYTAFVEPLSPSVNQQLIAQREAAALAETANEERSKEIPLPTEAEKIEQLNESLLRTYQSTLSQLNSQQPESVGQAVGRYKSLFIGRANKRTHDAAYVAFRKFYEGVLQHLRQQYKGQFQHLTPELNRYQRADMGANATLQILGDNGFNFALKNGQVVVAEDVDWIFRTFYREASTPMRVYMNQYELEEPNFWYQNDALLISPKQLSRWVLAWNYFVATYPDFVWHNDAVRRLSTQLGLLLEGTRKAPAFGANERLREDYKAAYTYIAEHYPNSNIGRAFIRYLEVLDHNDYERSSAVRSAQKNLRSALLEA